MPLTGPAAAAPFQPVRGDGARRARGARQRGPVPAGRRASSMARTRRFANEPLELLLECYERYGPVFTVRVLHGNVVFMLGPAANHYMTVSHAANFIWRESHFRDLIGLLGDGLLTIDGDFHRRSRQIMLPAFHRERIAASIDVMIEETDRALESSGGQRSGGRGRRGMGGSTSTPGRGTCDADRDARAVRPGPRQRARAGPTRRDSSRRRCRSTRREYTARFLRGPFTPWARLQGAARRLDRADLRRDRAPACDGRARRGRAEPAAGCQRRGRQHRSAIARCATR